MFILADGSLAYVAREHITAVEAPTTDSGSTWYVRLRTVNDRTYDLSTTYQSPQDARDAAAQVALGIEP